MKNQTFRMTMLFDFYGELLTDRQKEFYDLYYNEDLSLSEIAENYGISRQGVRPFSEISSYSSTSGASPHNRIIWKYRQARIHSA